MSQLIMTISRSLFFRLLAHAPEELQREAKADAKRAIPALCLTEEDIRQKFAQEELWEALTDAEQIIAIVALLDADEYRGAAAEADQAIAKAVGRYLHDAMLEKEERHWDEELT
jgi:hypothetical protein